VTVLLLEPDPDDPDPGEEFEQAAAVPRRVIPTAGAMIRVRRFMRLPFLLRL
jgi:hypothetical protein